MAKPLIIAVYKYPYCGRPDDTEIYLSETICRGTIKIRKNLVRKTKRVFVYGHLVLYLSSAVTPTMAIGLPFLPTSPSIMRLNPGLSKQAIIAQVIKDMPAETDFTKSEMEQLYRLAVECKDSSLSQEELIARVNNLRGGAFLDVVGAIGLIGAMIIVFLNYECGAFQPIVPPHLQWLYRNNNSNNPGPFGYNQCQSNPPSRFEREALHQVKQMCAAAADKNGFVMTYDEAYNLIKETYSGSMQITKECRVSDWQGAKKVYHFQKGFDIDLDKYPNINKQDLINLQYSEGGLIPYVQRGGKLPPIELIHDGQQKVYDFCHLENTEKMEDVKHHGRSTAETSCTMFFNRETRQIALFNNTSGDLITTEKFRQSYFNKCVDSGQIGKPDN